MPRPIRVLVANRPKLMRELIVSTLAEEPGVEIVGEVADETEVAERVREVSPDLLVIALDEPAKRPHLCDTLLRDHPELRIIAVASQENCSVFYWASFDIHSSEIEASEQGILNAVRHIIERLRLPRGVRGYGASDETHTSVGGESAPADAGTHGGNDFRAAGHRNCRRSTRRR